MRTRALTNTNEALGSEFSARKSAEGVEKQNEDRVPLIINTIPAMAWTVQPDGTVDFVNQRWLDYTGLTLEDEIEDPTRAIHPEDIPRVMEKWLADMAVGESYENELRLRRSDGDHQHPTPFGKSKGEDTSSSQFGTHARDYRLWSRPVCHQTERARRSPARSWCWYSKYAGASGANWREA